MQPAAITPALNPFHPHSLLSPLGARHASGADRRDRPADPVLPARPLAAVHRRPAVHHHELLASNTCRCPPSCSPPLSVRCPAQVRYLIGSPAARRCSTARTGRGCGCLPGSPSRRWNATARARRSCSRDSSHWSGPRSTRSPAPSASRPDCSRSGGWAAAVRSSGVAGADQPHQRLLFPPRARCNAGAGTTGLLLVSRRPGLLTTTAALLMAFARVCTTAHYPWDVPATWLSAPPSRCSAGRCWRHR